MAGQCCDNCVYSVCDPQVWHRSLWMGESIVPRCANHPQWPGQLHEVPGVPCRNYRRKPVLPEGDGVRMIPLGDGFYAYVDAADYEWLSRHTWHFNNGYAARRDKARRIYMHREIMQAPAGRVVDHYDANRVNNCRFNLRICTHQENQRNVRKRRGCRSRFKGVVYDKRRRKWCAKYSFGGRHYSIGHFDDEVDAARAYDRKAAESFGEFARLNFPDEWPAQRREEVCAQREAAKTEGKKKIGRKEGKTRAAAKRRAMTAKNGPKATRRKAKGRKREDSARIINRRSSIINPKGTPGRRDRTGTTKVTR